MKKTTSELLKLLKNSPSYNEYLTENGRDITETMKPGRALCALLAEKDLKKSRVIARSGIETHYAYQIFSDIKTPTRDKMIMLCFGFPLNCEETEHLLKITGYAPLYSKNQRDNALLFGLAKQLSVVEMNGLLFDLGLDLLI